MVEQRMMDMDRNRDGYVSLSEYTGQSVGHTPHGGLRCLPVFADYVWPPSERGAEEPEWLPREKEHFTNQRLVTVPA